MHLIIFEDEKIKPSRVKLINSFQFWFITYMNGAVTGSCR